MFEHRLFGRRRNPYDGLSFEAKEHHHKTLTQLYSALPISEQYIARRLELERKMLLLETAK